MSRLSPVSGGVIEFGEYVLMLLNVMTVMTSLPSLFYSSLGGMLIKIRECRMVHVAI